MMRRRLLIVLLAAAAAGAAPLAAQSGGELRFVLRSEPRSLHPHKVSDESSETIRYLTAGVLIRYHRRSQQAEPELASSWKILDGNRRIRFQLREGVSFSDGTPFTADDVAHTIRSLLDPQLHSATGDAFRGGRGAIQVEIGAPHRVDVVFSTPVAGLEKLFDEVAILSARSVRREAAALGPFFLAEHRPGSHILLQRNPHYWKRDGKGRRLPYLDAVRLEIQQNRELELLRFRRGQLHLINTLEAELFDRLSAESPALIHDAGPTLDSEQIWFNQVAAAPIPAYKKDWFRSRNFRRAISEAIHRDDLCRIVYRGHARPAVGPVSPANRFWFHAKLKPHAFDPKGALRRLAQDGFRLQQGVLSDRHGNPVEFSLVTNAGNRTRERIGAMLQQDLARIGIRLNLVALEFSSLIERITRTFAYEACLLGLVNVDVDPNGQMNVWLSSAANHQWNPGQKSPETPWEAEIDGLMRAQAAETDPRRRKAHFDRVQEIAWEEAPFLYLVNRNSLSAISPAVRNSAPVALRPQTYWNVEHLWLDARAARNLR